MVGRVRTLPNSAKHKLAGAEPWNYIHQQLHQKRILQLALTSSLIVSHGPEGKRADSPLLSGKKVCRDGLFSESCRTRVRDEACCKSLTMHQFSLSWYRYAGVGEWISGRHWYLPIAWNWRTQTEEESIGSEVEPGLDRRTTGPSLPRPGI